MRIGPILLVESDRRLGEALAQQLAADGYRVELAGNARHARILASETRPRLAVLGSSEGPRGPLELLEEIRSCEDSDPIWDRALPALVIGAGAGELEAIRALEAGADDFVAMPLGYLELRARLRAVLRRVDPPVAIGEQLAIGPLQIDLAGRSATLQGQPLDLRRMEFELLAHLATDPDRVFARGDLLCAIWGYRIAGSTRTVDTHASRLRAKMRDGGDWVIGIWGVGYRLR